MVRDDRVELQRAQATEWFVNSALGLEHGYTFNIVPRGERGEVRIQLAVGGGLQAESTADGVMLTDTSGSQRLRYHKLLVLDANGRKLDARLEVQPDNRLQIAFDDTHATYPIVVDPLLVSEEAKLTVSDGTVGNNFGVSVAVSGDTAVIGASTDSIGANSAQGSAYIFVRSGTRWSQQAKLTASDGTVGNGFGGNVARSGDTAIAGWVYVYRIGNDESNTPPVAARDRSTLKEDSGAKRINVLTNDSDPDRDKLRITRATRPAHGRVSVALDGGRLSYTPNANFQGSDSFNYFISDDRGGTASARVRVTVTNVDNDPPLARNDKATVPLNSGYTRIGVLANDSDPDPNPVLKVTRISTQAKSGQARISDGQVQYRPNAGFVGTDSFSYVISDGKLTARATVTVTVKR